MSKISAGELRIEKLSKDHDIAKFQCYEEERVNFLQEDALDNQEKKISVTFLVFLKEKNQMVAYLTLLNDRIDLENDLREYFSQKGILYKSLPALKIGRIAVGDHFLRKGIGKL